MPPITPPSEPPVTPQPTEDLQTKTLASDTAGKSSSWFGYLKFFFNWIVVPFIIVFLFQAFVLQAFYVSGMSMEPTFQNGDYLIISKVAVTTDNIRHLYDKQSTEHYQRGDVLVFRPPIATSTFYIKRIIGLPGDRVVIHDGVVTIYNTTHPSGMVLHESYIDPKAVTQGDIDETVDAHNFFVMGDNRTPNASYDSRDWGQLPQANVTGRVVLRLLPVSHFHTIGPATYSLLENPLRDVFKLLV